MNTKNTFTLKRIIISGVSLFALPMTLMATELNLMNEDVTNSSGQNVAQSNNLFGLPDYRMGFIDDALFRRVESIDDDGSGGGQFRNMADIKKPGNRQEGWQNGYNRNGAGDGSVPGGFTSNALISVGDLATDVDGGYYVFAVDVNEANSGPTRFVSLDEFKIYTGGYGLDTDESGDLDPTEVTEAWGTDPLPQTTLATSADDLAAYTSLIYDMDSVEDSSVFIDYSTSNGSGTYDFLIFVPTAKFAGTLSTDMVYVYTEFGSYGTTVSHDFTVEAGAEQIAAYTGDFLGTGIKNVPEPSSTLLSLFGALFLLGRRARS